jgi:hypothetical protein
MPQSAATNAPRALSNAAKFTAAPQRVAASEGRSNGPHNQLVLLNIFWRDFSCDHMRRTRSYDRRSSPCSTRKKFSFASSMGAREIHGGKIDVLVGAAGFTASLILRTNGNRQTVQIGYRDDIRGESITMVRS